MIKCKKCGKEHTESSSNCCWIDCDCGVKICGMCGGTDIGNMDMDPDDDDAKYWCCSQCQDCGLIGCAMCI